MPKKLKRYDSNYNHRRNEERSQGALGPPNKEQNGANKEENLTKKGPFWGVVFHEKNSSKTNFRSKGAEFFAPQKLFLAQP